MPNPTCFTTFREFITEMIVHGTISNNKFVIAFQKDIFIFNDDDLYDELPTILQQLKEYLPEYRIDISLTNDTLDIYEVFEILVDRVNDIVCAKLTNDTLIVYKGKIDNRNSLLIYKIVHQFKITYVYDEDVFYDETLIEPTILDRFPNVGFHGTSSTYLTSILRSVLNQSGTNKNWNFVLVKEIEGRIYFTTKSITALFHANRTTDKIVKSGVPIIIEFVIPDKNRIVPDRDVIKYTGITKGTESAKRTSISQKPLSLSKELGIYAYDERVPASFIQAIWIPAVKKHTQGFFPDKYTQTDFIRVQPKEAIRQLGVFSL